MLLALPPSNSDWTHEMPHDVTALFAGIGGIELGLAHAGHRASLFCENDPEAVAVLRHRFPQVPVVPDVRDVDEILDAASPDSTLLTAGFPCTDLSQAGRTEGFAGTKSSLIRSVLVLLERRRFQSVLVENVPNWRVLHKGAYMREILDAFESLGYRWAYRTIDSLAFGVPQRRQRVFLYATLEGDPRRALFTGDEEPIAREYELHEEAHGFYWTEGNRGLGWGENCVPTLKGGSGLSIPSSPAILMPDGQVVTPDIRDAEKLQGFPADWTNAEEVEDAEGFRRTFNHRRRWLLTGNAVNVAVSQWIGEQLNKLNDFDGDPGEPLDPGGRLPSAAWFDGNTRYGVELRTWPVARNTKSLSEFLEYPTKPLSERATKGFYSRICKSTLPFKPGFREAIHAHLTRLQQAPEQGKTRVRA